MKERKIAIVCGTALLIAAAVVVAARNRLRPSFKRESSKFEVQSSKLGNGNWETEGRRLSGDG